MRRTNRHKGFTLVELIIGLSITAIVGLAVSVLAMSMTYAGVATDDIARKQAWLRTADVQLDRIVRGCRMICGKVDNSLVIWNKDSDGDGLISGKELLIISASVTADSINLISFPESGWAANETMSLSQARSSTAINSLLNNCNEIVRPLIPECRNASVVADTSMDEKRFVRVTFELSQDGNWTYYDLACSIRTYSGNIVRYGAIVADDD